MGGMPLYPAPTILYCSDFIPRLVKEHEHFQWLMRELMCLLATIPCFFSPSSFLCLTGLLISTNNQIVLRTTALCIKSRNLQGPISAKMLPENELTTALEHVKREPGT